MVGPFSLQRFSAVTIANGLAAASVLAALLFAALDAITFAIGAGVTAAGFVLIAGVAAVYRALPADDREHLLSRKVVRSTAITSLLLAIGVSCTYWYAAWLLPDWLISQFHEVLLLHWGKLDFIPSSFAQLLPIGWQSGFHRYFNEGTYCFPREPWWESMRYLRVAIPGYAVTFFCVLLVVRVFWAMARNLMQRSRL